MRLSVPTLGPGPGKGEAQPELSAARPSTYYWLYIQRYQYVLQPKNGFRYRHNLVGKHAELNNYSNISMLVPIFSQSLSLFVYLLPQFSLFVLGCFLVSSKNQSIALIFSMLSFCLGLDRLPKIFLLCYSKVCTNCFVTLYNFTDYLKSSLNFISYQSFPIL